MERLPVSLYFLVHAQVLFCNMYPAQNVAIKLPNCARPSRGCEGPSAEGSVAADTVLPALDHQAFGLSNASTISRNESSSADK